MLQVSVLGPWALVVLIGDFDTANSDEIRVTISDLVERGVTDVTVDLSLAGFVAAATLNALVASHNRISSMGGRLMTMGIGGLTARIFDITDLTGTLSAFTAPPAQPLVAGPEVAGPSADAEMQAAIGGIEAGLVGAFSELSSALLCEPTLTGDFGHIVGAATAVLPECVAASLSLVVGGEPRSATATNRIAAEVDIAQYRCDEGPCLHAARRARRVRVDVLEGERRFTQFAPLALEIGIRSTLSAPIALRRHVVGSINLYSANSGGFDRGSEAVADLLAGQAAVAVVKNDLRAGASPPAASEAGAVDGFGAGQGEGSVEAVRDLLRDAAGAHHESLLDAAQRLLAAVPPGA